MSRCVAVGDTNITNLVELETPGLSIVKKPSPSVISKQSLCGFFSTGHRSLCPCSLTVFDLMVLTCIEDTCLNQRVLN